MDSKGYSLSCKDTLGAGEDMVFKSAANFGASTILTHNIKDFLNPELAAYEIEILTPGEFIKIIGERL